MSLEVDGARVLKAVYKKEDIYHGPHMDGAPDLVLLSNYGFDLKGSIQRDVLSEKGFLSGMHTQDDAMLYLSRKLSDGGGESAGPSILDASATIAGWLGIAADEMKAGRWRSFRLSLRAKSP